jgi:hypothetical protein
MTLKLLTASTFSHFRDQGMGCLCVWLPSTGLGLLRLVRASEFAAIHEFGTAWVPVANQQLPRQLLPSGMNPKQSFAILSRKSSHHDYDDLSTVTCHDTLLPSPLLMKLNKASLVLLTSGSCARHSSAPSRPVQPGTCRAWN